MPKQRGFEKKMIANKDVMVTLDQWRELMHIKADNNHRSMSVVISKLLANYKKS